MMSVAVPARDRGIRSLQTLYIGLWTGGLLTTVMIGSLILANRVPQLERFAYARNLCCYAAALAVMLLPLWRLYHSPARLFVSGVLGWLIASISYAVASAYYPNLEGRVGKTTLEYLTLGVIVYGIVAVASWVVNCILFHAAHARGLRRENPRIP
jgi:hypothetical protein